MSALLGTGRPDAIGVVGIGVECLHPDLGAKLGDPVDILDLAEIRLAVRAADLGRIALGLAAGAGDAIEHRGIVPRRQLPGLGGLLDLREDALGQ